MVTTNKYAHIRYTSEWIFKQNLEKSEKVSILGMFLVRSGLHLMCLDVCTSSWSTKEVREYGMNCNSRKKIVGVFSCGKTFVGARRPYMICRTFRAVSESSWCGRIFLGGEVRLGLGLRDGRWHFLIFHQVKCSGEKMILLQEVYNIVCDLLQKTFHQTLTHH